MDEELLADWRQLPHNPRGFFGLGDPFDRRDLKRAYGKLIRKFKPETHPDEFQRIRAAYEDVESFLRYGESYRDTTRGNQAWNITTPDPDANSQTGDQNSQTGGQQYDRPKVDRPTAPQTIVEQALAQQRTTYQSLSAKRDRTPQEHYILAVLSDLADPDNRQTKFIEWLLIGLKSHPSDRGLQALVQQYIRNEVSLEDAPSILKAVAAATRSPVFYRMTESLWEKMLREWDFNDFFSILTKCESLIRQTDDDARNTFYLRILRTAVWKAPRRWTNERIDELESQATRFRPYSLHELEFVTMLRDYLANTTQSLSRYESRARLERFLYHFCTSDGPAATAEMTSELSQIARAANSVRAAFPVLSDRDETPLYMLTYMATDELKQSAGLGFETIDEQQNNLLAKALLVDLQPTQNTIVNALNSISFHHRWISFLIGLAISVVLTILMMAGGIAISTQNPIPMLSGLVIIPAYIVAYIVWLYPKYISPRLDRAQGERWWQLYEEHWRERVFRYVQSCSEPPAVALERVVSVGRARQQEDWAGLIHRFATNDIGLMIFSQTQAFVV